jgi:lysozyme family protein
MSKTLDQIIDDIIDKEGGYVDHKRDRGGATKYGVTLKTLSAYRGKPCSKQDVKNLTKKEATSIFMREYIIAPKINLLPSQIQPILADMSVLHGPKRAVILLQLALLGHGAGLVVDGNIGNRTISVSKAYLLSLGERVLINSIVRQRKEFCRSIVAKDPSQKVFLAGWINRANSFYIA